MSAPTRTLPRWSDSDDGWSPKVVEEIATWPDLQATAHRMVHPYGNIAGCDLCVVVTCRYCDALPEVCPDLDGHDRLHRGSESTWLNFVGQAAS